MKTFEELDYAQTALGELILRRRRTTRGEEVFEVKLDGAFLMSSLVNTSEIALADLSLEARSGPVTSVLVGGLGLGYTAATVLDDPDVQSVVVVEILPEVVRWHERGLVPLSSRLTSDARCRFVQASFFDYVETCDDRFDAILIDIDHSPVSLLDASHAPFYSTEGLSTAASILNPNGVFGLWSGDGVDPAVVETLTRVFAKVDAHPVRFRNPLLDIEDTNTVYVALAP